MRLVLVVLALLGLTTPAFAHPHIWIQQVVRVVEKNGQFTHVELEWRFDPYASELEIPLIDENKDGKFSKREMDLLGKDMIPELKKYGFMTQLSLDGGADVSLSRDPVFTARIDSPATFTLPDWDRNAGDTSGGTQPMPPNKTVQPPVPQQQAQRNLVYVMRFELPKPAKTLSVTTFDKDDFIRIELDQKSAPTQCKIAKSTTHKAEYIRGYPVFADTVSCQLP